MNGWAGVPTVGVDYYLVCGAFFILVVFLGLFTNWIDK